jgi:polysaccharide export outer membrane protein
VQLTGTAEMDNTSVIASSWRHAEHVAAEAPPTSATPAPLPDLRPVAASFPDGGVQPAIQTQDGAPVPIATTGRVTTEEPPSQLPLPRIVSGPVEMAPLMTAAPVEAAPHGLHPTPDVPREGAKQALPPYIVEPPDVLLVQASSAVLGPKSRLQPVDGSHLVRPDGTLDLGIYGQVFVAGMTLDQIRTAVAAQLLQTGARTYREPKINKMTGLPELDPSGTPIVEGEPKPYTIEQVRSEVRVDVIAYNSKAYYVITNNGGFGEGIFRVPITGNETVLDALSYIQGLPTTSSPKHIWLARSTKDPEHPMVMPVDYRAIARLGAANTNYQLYPGDRIYVDADKKIKVDSWLAKVLAPVDRVLGTALLGGTAYNVLTNRTGGSGSGTGR